MAILNPSAVDKAVYEVANQGIRVERAAANLPATADVALFSITGTIRLVQIIGKVSTVIQTQANNTKLKYNPTGAGNDTDLCAVLNISADAVGTWYGITGVVSDAMIEGIRTIAGMTTPRYLEDGDIELDCAATNTGQVSWTLWYVPVSDGANVVAV